MPVTDYTPTVAQVAALVRNRTRDANGNVLGTFQTAADGRTTPTSEQVTELIQDAVNEAYPVFGDDIPDNPGDTTRPGYDKDTIRKAATRNVAMRAAALVELTYFADQVGSGKSPYPQYQDSFEKGLPRLGKAITEAQQGDEVGTGDDAPGPAWEFPLPDPQSFGTRAF